MTKGVLMKIIKSIFVLMLFLSLTLPVSAQTNTRVSFESNEDALTFIDNVQNSQLNDGDQFITKDAVAIGLKYAEVNADLNNSRLSNLKNANGVSIMSSGYETWTITNAETIKPYGIVYGDYNGAKLTAGQSNTFGFSLSLNVISSIGLSATATWSITQSFSGPSGSDLVTTGVFATHRVFSAIMKSSVVKYTYRVTDMYTGVYLRTETRTYSANNATETYSNFVNINPSSGLFMIRSASNSNYKSYTNEGIWSGKVNSSAPAIHIYF